MDPGNLPDTFPLGNIGVVKFQKAGKLAGLRKAYKKYTSPLRKEYLTRDTGDALSEVISVALEGGNNSMLNGEQTARSPTWGRVRYPAAGVDPGAPKPCGDMKRSAQKSGLPIP